LLVLSKEPILLLWHGRHLVEGTEVKGARLGVLGAVLGVHLVEGVEVEVEGSLLRLLQRLQHLLLLHLLPTHLWVVVLVDGNMVFLLGGGLDLLLPDLLLELVDVIGGQVLVLLEARARILAPLALLLLIFDLEGFITELGVVAVPVGQDLDDLLDGRSFGGGGHEHRPDEVLHLLRDAGVLWHEVVGVHDGQLLGVLKRVRAVAKRVHYAPQHPDVRLAVDGVLLVLVDHLWGPVHQGRVLFELLKHLVDP